VFRDHFWYDPESKQRLYGRGGQMVFVYDRSRQKSIPRIIDSEEWVYEDSYDDIVKWVDQTGVEVIDKVPGHSVIINVSITEWPDFESDLYQNAIVYDYEESQLQHETSGFQEKKTWQNSPSKWQIRQRH